MSNQYLKDEDKQSIIDMINMSTVIYVNKMKIANDAMLLIVDLIDDTSKIKTDMTQESLSITIK